MDFTISGQRMHTLSPYDFTPPLEADPTDPGKEYRLDEVMTDLASKHLLQPLVPGTAVKATATDPGGTTITLSEQLIGQILALPLSRTPDGRSGDTPENNRAALDLLAQTVTGVSHRDYPYLRQVFMVQALNSVGLPMPDQVTLYSAGGDVIPGARQVLDAVATGTTSTAYDKGTDAWSTFFGSLCATYKPSTLGLAFLGPETFSEFAEHLVATAGALVVAGKITMDVENKCKQIRDAGLNGLTEGIILRRDENDISGDYSFARLLVSVAQDWILSEERSAADGDRAATASIMPFDMSEWIMPLTVVFINTDAHARRDPKEISKEWNRNNAISKGGIHMVSTKTLSKFSTMDKAQTGLKQIVRERKNASSMSKRDATEGDFDTMPPTPRQSALEIAAHLKRMASVNRSENIFRYRKKDPNRSNRRRPDDPNIPGRRVAKEFYPDLHIYADTSGSMSEADYRDIVLLTGMLAKKLDVNLYFSSHSHVLSSETRIPTKGRSVGEIAKMLTKIDKVSGGNRFEMIYDYIQASPERKRRLNIVATDFGWAAGSHLNFTHPKNLIYVPAFDRTDSVGWDTVKSQASSFINSMRPFDSNIDSRLKGMGYTVAPPVVNTP